MKKETQRGTEWEYSNYGVGYTIRKLESGWLVITWSESPDGTKSGVSYHWPYTREFPKSMDPEDAGNHTRIREWVPNHHGSLQCRGVSVDDENPILGRS